jgi:hypothetical protein
MLLPDDARIEDAAGGVQRIDGGIDAKLGDLVASRCANDVAGAGSVKSSAGT